MLTGAATSIQVLFNGQNISVLEKRVSSISSIYTAKHCALKVVSSSSCLMLCNSLIGAAVVGVESRICKEWNFQMYRSTQRNIHQQLHVIFAVMVHVCMYGLKIYVKSVRLRSPVETADVDIRYWWRIWITISSARRRVVIRSYIVAIIMEQ